jgi:hypothetical protein
MQRYRRNLGLDADGEQRSEHVRKCGVFMHHNFCRIHRTLRVTPVMEAGLSDHVWEIDELVALLRR